jgi:hypothetical protein
MGTMGRGWEINARRCLGKNVILTNIRVSVVLSQSVCRKEREKLDITLDRHSVCLKSLGNLEKEYFFKVYQNQLGLSGMFDCHNKC